MGLAACDDMRSLYGTILALTVATAWRPPAALADPVTALWRQRCAPCHGMDGRGYNLRAQRMAMGDMTAESWQIEMTDQHIRDTVLHGLRRVKLGNRQVMKHFKGKLTAAQIEALITHIRSFGRAPARGGWRWGWSFW